MKSHRASWSGRKDWLLVADILYGAYIFVFKSYLYDKFEQDIGSALTKDKTVVVL